jgi:hypothetical protein
MNVVLALLAVSALVGLALGVFFSWIAIFVSGVIIAICGGMISHNESLEFFAGISFIVACLCINQIAYRGKAVDLQTRVQQSIATCVGFTTRLKRGPSRARGVCASVFLESDAHQMLTRARAGIGERQTVRLLLCSCDDLRGRTVGQVL